MNEYLIKRSSFSLYAFGDSVSEKDFRAKNFIITVNNGKVYFSLELLKELDYSLFESNNNYFDTFVFEDRFVIRKLITFLKSSNSFTSFVLRIKKEDCLQVNLTNIKVQQNAIIFQSFC